MNRNKWIIILVTLVLLALLLGVYMICENYQLGQRLNHEANVISTYSASLARNIAFLEDEFQKADVTNGNVRRSSFDYALGSAQAGFSNIDTILLPDKQILWSAQLQELYNQVSLGGDMKYYFTNKADVVASLRSQLENMTNTLVEFRDSYNKTSFWERCFHSWKTEQLELSNKIEFLYA